VTGPYETEAQVHDALQAVREALDIPHAATVGDDEIRAKVMERRVMHAVTFLRGVLDLEPPPLDIGWHVAYLRERLAEHPAAGYKTWDEAIAELRAAEAAKAEHAAATMPGCGKCETAPAARPGETRPDGQPSMNALFCARCLDRCHEATDFAHVCIICASPEERAALGLGGPGQDGDR